MAGAGPSKVLVTGAGGFIGSHLAADQLHRGHRVVAFDLRLDRVAHLRSPGTFELIRGDVANPELQKRALDNVGTVFHLAAAHLSVNAGEAEFRRVNVEAVRTLVEACARAGVKRLVHCSTVGVYGRLESPPVNEGAPCHPELPYERTKLEGERVVLEAVRSSGFPAVVIRPVWVYGPGCPRTAKLFHAIERGRFLVAGRARALRHCVYIRDMVEAFHLAATADEAALGQVVIVGGAEAGTVRQLVDEIAELTGASPPLTVPLSLLYAAGLTAELVFRFLGKEPPLSRRTLRFFTANTAFDITRARQLLGYEPGFDLSSGLRETYRLLRSGRASALPMPRSVKD